MNVNIVLFDDFDMLDAFGPAQIFGMAPQHFYLNYLSVKGGIINSSNGAKVWTEFLIPQEVEDILVIPGGKGARKLVNLEPESLEIIKHSAEMADRCLLIGNGSGILEQTGLLFHRKIVDYNLEENWKTAFTAGITRIPDIKWMADGKFYSCNSSTSSIDMALGVVADVVDIDIAEKIAHRLGYDWDADSEDGFFL